MSASAFFNLFKAQPSLPSSNSASASASAADPYLMEFDRQKRELNEFIHFFKDLAISMQLPSTKEKIEATDLSSFNQLQESGSTKEMVEVATTIKIKIASCFVPLDIHGPFKEQELPFINVYRSYFAFRQEPQHKDYTEFESIITTSDLQNAQKCLSIFLNYDLERIASDGHRLEEVSVEQQAPLSTRRSLNIIQAIQTALRLWYVFQFQKVSNAAEILPSDINRDVLMDIDRIKNKSNIFWQTLNKSPMEALSTIKNCLQILIGMRSSSDFTIYESAWNCIRYVIESPLEFENESAAVDPAEVVVMDGEKSPFEQLEEILSNWITSGGKRFYQRKIAEKILNCYKKGKRSLKLSIPYKQDSILLPNCFHYLSHLNELEIYYKQHPISLQQQDLPASIEALTNLKRLSLHGDLLNNLSSIITSLSQLQELQIAGSSANSLPNEICSLECLRVLKITSLPYLQFLPENLGNLTNLKHLQITHNRKINSKGNIESGLQTLPVSFENLYSLETLDLSYNLISRLPSLIGGLKKLRHLKLNNNRGSSLFFISDSLTGLTQLQTLDLSNNLLTPLPHNIGQLQQLEVLKLSKTKLSTLPDSIKNLHALKHLDLSGCLFRDFQEQVYQLKSLERLLINHSLHCPMPDGIGKMKSLVYLEMMDNKLQNLPLDIGECENLRYLQLHGNQLRTLPDSIGNLSSLLILGLGSNRLSQLPNSFENLSNLVNLYVNNNSLQGIPIALLKLNRLELLDISANPLKSFLNNHEPAKFISIEEFKKIKQTEDKDFYLENRSNSFTA